MRDMREETSDSQLGQFDYAAVSVHSIPDLKICFPDHGHVRASNCLSHGMESMEILILRAQPSRWNMYSQNWLSEASAFIQFVTASPCSATAGYSRLAAL